MLRRNRRNRRYLTLSFALAMSACAQPSGEPTTESVAPVTSDAAEGAAARSEGVPRPEPTRYPKGRWRLVPFTDLLAVSLPLSHLLIRHSEATSSQVSLNLLAWRTALPPSSRSRAEALALAEQLAERAQGNPLAFAALAREFSEDPITAASGGSLGAVTATQLWAWPRILDALAATPAGAVTGVVETEFGFHVFERRLPPPEYTRSGVRVVIGHADAPFLGFSARRGVPARSRAEAEALAGQVYQEAREHPERFEQLVERYSDHEDVLRGGDFGTWSSHEPTFLPREVETLGELAVGGVAPPIETLFGFQIIQRTVDRVRERYLLSKLELSFDPAIPDGEAGSRREVLQRMRAFSRQIAQDPSSFRQLQKQVCCTAVFPLVAGRDEAVIDRLLATLEPGGIGADVLETGQRFMIVKRELPGSLPPPSPTSFDLPSPATPKLSDVMDDYSSRFIAEQVAEVAKQAMVVLEGLSRADGDELLSLHRFFESDQPDTAEQRHRALDQLEARARAQLGDVRYLQYRGLLEARFAAAILDL